MAETTVLYGAPTFLPFTDRSSDMESFNKTASSNGFSQQVNRGDASDSTDYTSAQDAVQTSITKNADEKLPHEAIRSEDRDEPMSMSWWPLPDDLMMVAEARSNQDYDEAQVATRLKPQRQPSIFKKLESRLAGFVHGHHNKTASPGGDTDTEIRHALSKAPKPLLLHSNESNSLFHVILTTSHLEKDVNSQIQGVRICGTFDSLPAAKAFAHRCLFDQGYEQDWFTTFRTQHDLQLVDHKEDKIVEATGPAGEVFTVNISTVPNSFGLKSKGDGKGITVPLFHVVQTIVHYEADESGQTRDTTIQGSYTSYERAREVAHKLLLWFEDGIDKSTYVQYEEAAEGETDCGYGENVIVHAVGEQGSNYLVSILKGEELESVRVAEAAEIMRA